MKLKYVILFVFLIIISINSLTFESGKNVIIIILTLKASSRRNAKWGI